MDYPVIYAGHGDLVDDGHGNWYVVMLASRPCRKHSSMGRETFLAKVIWENGWPVIAPGVGHLEEQVEIPMEEYRFAQEVTKCDQIHFWDKELDQRLIGIGGCDETIYSLKEKEGMLRLYPRKESIAEAAYCSYLGLRQKSYRFEAETGVFFVPENEKETAGLVLYQNYENHLRMEIAKKQEQKVFRVVTCIKGTETKAAEVLLPGETEQLLKIRLQCHDQTAKVWIASENGWECAAEEISLLPYTTEEAGGFVGCTIGMYASSNGMESKNHADFAWFTCSSRN
jgi:xylan 1,4-beta-xylosidase